MSLFFVASGDQEDLKINVILIDVLTESIRLRTVNGGTQFKKITEYKIRRTAANRLSSNFEKDLN